MIESLSHGSDGTILLTLCRPIFLCHLIFHAIYFIKAPAYQDGHAGYSNPLDEQTFVVEGQKLQEWNDTAIIITYDDSDGWYDHVMPPIMSQSDDSKTDALLGSEGLCGHPLSRPISRSLWLWTAPTIPCCFSLFKSELS